METQIFEGTFVEVQQQLKALPLDSEARVRVVISNSEPTAGAQETLQGNASSRNGLLFIPTKAANRAITLELVSELRDE